MKKFKKGFSLAEILIALAIISIIAVMGFSITKKSTEKAYNLYIYTGYSAIQNAMADASARGFELDYNDFREENEYISHIIKLLNATVDKEKTTSSRIFISTPNNIKYELENYKKVLLYIKMTVPSVAHKIKIDNVDVVKRTKTFTFTYLGPKNCNRFHGINFCETLIPEKEIEYNEGEEIKTNYIDLSNRMDLLPFYIDGSSPRLINYYDNETKTFKTEINNRGEKTHYMSYTDAYKKKTGRNKKKFMSISKELSLRTPDDEIVQIEYHDWYNIDNSLEKENGPIKVANPRKVF